MRRIDFSQEFPLSQKGIIKQLKEKILILSPMNFRKTLYQITPEKTTPKFNISIEKTVESYKHSDNKRITRMYKLNNRTSSAFPTGNSSESHRRLKSCSVTSKSIYNFI